MSLSPLTPGQNIALGLLLDRQPRVYLAGPMRGYPDFNFPAFHDAARWLRHEGFEVWSPAENDESEGFDPTKDEALPLRHYMKTDLPAVCDSDLVVVLPGWANSEGAKLEVHVASRCSIPVYELGEIMFADLHGFTPRPLTFREHRADEVISATSGHTVSDEVRVTSSTGGQKGTKPERYSLLPWAELDEVARLYAFGAMKYDDHNWMRGYDWHLSFDAGTRHWRAFWGGESIDPETGCHHLSSVVFHALALMYFEKHFPDFDDRPPAPANG